MDFHAVKTGTKRQIGGLRIRGDECFDFFCGRFACVFGFVGGSADFVETVQKVINGFGTAVMDLQNRFCALLSQDLCGFFQAVEAVFACGFRLAVKGFAVFLNQSGGRDKQAHIACAVAEEGTLLVTPLLRVYV